MVFYSLVSGLSFAMNGFLRNCILNRGKNTILALAKLSGGMLYNRSNIFSYINNDFLFKVINCKAHAYTFYHIQNEMITKYFQNVLWERMDQIVCINVLGNVWVTLHVTEQPESGTLAAILGILEYSVTQVNLIYTLIGFNRSRFFFRLKEICVIHNFTIIK